MPSKIRYFFKKKIVIALFAVPFAVFCSWKLVNFVNEGTNSLLLSLDFRPKIFNITGNHIVSKNHLKNIICAEIQDENSSKNCISKWSIVYTSPWAIKNILKDSTPWIKDVMIIRQIPDTFEINIKEYTPFAVWNNKVVLDAEGNKIYDKKYIENNSVNLIKVNSPSSQMFLSFIGLIKHNNELIKNIKSLEYINERRWDLMLKNDLLIKLPELKPDNALLRLIKSDRYIFSNKGTKVIDVRVKDKTFVTG